MIERSLRRHSNVRAGPVEAQRRNGAAHARESEAARRCALVHDDRNRLASDDDLGAAARLGSRSRRKRSGRRSVGATVIGQKQQPSSSLCFVPFPLVRDENPLHNCDCVDRALLRLLRFQVTLHD